MSIDIQPPFRLPVNDEGHDRVSALFLGPKAENFDMLTKLFGDVLKSQEEVRKNYHPEDKDFITQAIKASSGFQSMKTLLEDNLKTMTGLLNAKSVPFFSPRYSAHMTTDVMMPGILGYMSTMMFNPNNVAFEASPITTWMELEVGLQLCEMLGYHVAAPMAKIPGQINGWGHITCDGTVANLEAIWSARNLKFYPFALRDAMAPGAPLAFIAPTFFVEVTGIAQKKKLFTELTNWELLNLRVTNINEIPNRLYDEYNISSAFLDAAMQDYIIQTLSKDYLERKWDIKDTPQILIASTKHYSWPKGAAIAGIGSKNVVDVPVDHDARIDLELLRAELETRLAAQRAVYMIVAIIGSTEEGAVDPLEDMVALRDEMEERGMSFVLHADAAWGGYFASMVRRDPKRGRAPTGDEEDSGFVPQVGLRENTRRQLEHLQYADSITIDPHKAGYIPYPAGSLCYRDERQKYLLTWTAPYIHQGTEGESIGVYGVEGSKPGASAGAVWLAHAVNPLHENGHGALLGEAAFNCRRFASHWSAMSTDCSTHIVVPFNPIPAERETNATEADIEAQKEFIRKRILPKSNEELVQDEDAMLLLNQLGSDLNINCFACNFRDADGNPNTDVELANRLNWLIFQELSVTNPTKDPASVPFYLTSTTFAQKDYKECATNFKKRLGLKGDQDVFVLRNVVMSPFGSTDNFVLKLAEYFREVLDRNIAEVIKLSTPTPATHTFLVHGTDHLYFVHLPSLYRAGGGYQLIFFAKVPPELQDEFRRLKAENPDTTYVLHNSSPGVVEVLLEKGSFLGYITELGKNEPINGKSYEVSDIQIIKKRTLRTKDYHAEYPWSMPFYLYGTPTELQIDHMLLIAPNIQLTSGSVSILWEGEPPYPSDKELENPEPESELARGMIIVADNIYERAMQPFPKTEDLLEQGNKFFFTKGNSFTFTAYADPYPASYDERIDMEKVTQVLGKGTLTLQAEIYVDSVKLNEDATYQPPPSRSQAGDLEYAIHGQPGLSIEPVPDRFHSSGYMQDSEKAGWVKYISDALST